MGAESSWQAGKVDRWKPDKAESPGPRSPGKGLSHLTVWYIGQGTLITEYSS